MRNKIIFGLLILSIVFILGANGCETQDSVVCNDPYIRVGSDCCLDKDSNNICDDDEEIRDQAKVVEDDGFKTNEYGWEVKVSQESGDEASNQLDCLNNVKLELSGASFNTASNTITFTVNNNGNKGIKSFIGRYTTDAGIFTEAISQTIAVFSSKQINSKTLTGASSVTKVELLSPIIDNDVECTEIREVTTTIT